MKKDEIKRHLSRYKNVLDMIREANILKANGESEIMVNRCVAELRKEMLSSYGDIVKIQRSIVEDTEMSVIGYIPVQVDNISAPIVVFDGTNVLI